MRTTKFDASYYLDDEEMLTEYLKAVIEENDIELFVTALGNLAKAKGISSIAKEAGLTRTSLYKSINGNTKPKLDTVNKILNTFGLGLDVRALK